MRLGLIARGDRGGVAAQTFDFYKYMYPDKILLIDYDKFTGQSTDHSKYPGALVTDREPSHVIIEKFLEDLDIVFTVETAYNPDFFDIARKRGVKTILQYNYEWLQQLQDPDKPLPDLLLAPSQWHREDMPYPTRYLHVPVDREKFVFSLHTRAKKFLHIAGHGAHRNGTQLLIDALPYIQSDIQIVIRTQEELNYSDHRLTVIKDDLDDNRQLFNDEDILVLPRRYGGLSLQLNEALSLGMPAIMLDVQPQTELLPASWLVEPHLKEELMIKTMINVWECRPKALAQKIDEFAGKDISRDSMWADDFSAKKDWKVMRSKYNKVFEDVINNRYPNPTEVDTATSS